MSHTVDKTNKQYILLTSIRISDRSLPCTGNRQKVDYNHPYGRSAKPQFYLFDTTNPELFGVKAPGIRSFKVNNMEGGGVENFRPWPMVLCISIADCRSSRSVYC